MQHKIPRTLRLAGNDLDRIRQTFDFDPSETERVGLEDGPGSFKRLSSRQRRRIQNNLGNRRRRYAIRNINALVSAWKEGVRTHRESAHEFERIVKEAFESDAPVRFDEISAPDVGETAVRTFKDLYRVSQAFLDANYGPHRTLYRGIRDKSIAVLAAQVIDNPDAGQYYFETSVISNHTGSEAVGYSYANGVVIEWDVHRYWMTLAIDQIFETATPEDEVQVLGGVITLGPDAIIHRGHHTGAIRMLSTSFRRIDSPRSMSYEEHMDIVELVRILEKEDVGVRTDEGAERLGRWFRAFQSASPLPDQDLNRLQNVVDAVRVLDHEKEWDH